MQTSFPLPDRLPRGIRRMRDVSLRAMANAFDPDGTAPLHPDAVGVTIGLFDWKGLLWAVVFASPALILAIVLPASHIGGVPTGILTAAAAAILAQRSPGGLGQLYSLRTVIVLEPERIRWRRTTWLGSAAWSVDRHDIASLDLAWNGRYFSLSMCLCSGETRTPLKPSADPQTTGGLAWLLHKALNIRVTGNVCLAELEKAFPAGALSAGSLIGQPIKLREITLADRRTAAPPIGIREHGFRYYGGSDWDLAPDMQNDAVAFVILRESLNWGASLFYLAAGCLFGYGFLWGGVRHWLIALLCLAFLTAFLHFFAGKIWLFADAEGLTVRRQWLGFKYDRRISRDKVTGVGSMRDGIVPDKHYIGFELSGEKKRLVFRRVASDAEAWIVPLLAAWAGVPVLQRLQLLPEKPTRSARSAESAASSDRADC